MTINTLKVYLVGGAIRDTLLALPVTEHDYVVVGATPEYMIAQGFSQVGADFPVFLHPHTHDEYALARTERKSGNGYLGFSVHASPEVTLEEDLIRRDLTINAMAIEVNGLFDSRLKHGSFNKAHVIDPYGGLQDIERKQLRHVSDAFAEDPVRVLRLARFASRYAPLGFSIAEETVKLVQKMRDDGELNHLVAERVWAETRKALMQTWSDVYFSTLSQLDVLGVVMPALSIAREEGLYTEKLSITNHALRLAHCFSLDEMSRFALLCTTFLNFENDKSLAFPTLFNDFCQKLKVPKSYSHFAELLLTQFDNLQNFSQLSSERLFDLIKTCNSLKQPNILQQLLIVSKIYQLAFDQMKLEKILATIQPIGINDVDKDLKGKAIGEAIEQLRLEKLAEIIADKLTFGKIDKNLEDKL